MPNKPLVITEKTIIFSDLDGTAFELLRDPEKRRFDPTVLYAFALFHQVRPNHVIPNTGRDYRQVLSCLGGHKPFFPVIANTGADLVLPNGARHSYNFSPDEVSFIDKARNAMASFGQNHPHLVTEVKERCIGFHSSHNASYIHRDTRVSLDALVQNSASQAFQLLTDLRLEAEQKNMPFRIVQTDATHRELNHALINKVDAVGWFGNTLTTLPRGDNWENVLFCCDSLRGEGNDRDMAQATRNKGGTVIMVTNKDSQRIPREQSVAEPHFAVETPSELGDVLLHHVRKMIVTGYGMKGLRSFEEAVQDKGFKLNGTKHEHPPVRHFDIQFNRARGLEACARA